jgi:hypothetical protein
MATVGPKALVAAERPWLPPQGQWTYEEWLRLPDDAWQYQVIKGVLYMVPAPTTVLAGFQLPVDAILAM